MVTIMFVDDDVHVLRGYERKIDWSSMDVKVIGTASDGKEALEAIINLKPDIVLTDIKMPVMDGLELLKAIDAMGLHTHVIIQSGYNEFDFAKQAIKYNAFAYLLKPTSKEEIVEVVGEVIESIKEEKSIKAKLLSNKFALTKSRIVESLMTQASTESISGLVLACCENVALTDKVLSVIVHSAQQPIEDVQRNEENHQASFNGVISHRWDENNWVIHYFMDAEVSDKEVLKKVIWEMVELRESFDDDHIRIALGSIGSNINELSSSLAVAISGIDLKGLVKANELIIPKGEGVSSLRAKFEVNALEEAIECQEEERILDELNKMFAWIKATDSMDKYQYEQMMTTIFKMVLLLLKYPGSSESLPSEYEIWEGLMVHDCIESLEFYVRQLVHDIIQVKHNYEEKHLSKPIQYVVDFVNKHYMSTILLKDLSKSLYMSENYLSTLFKKEMTLTFKKYLTMVRMENAKELLSNPRLKIHHVAQQAGYSNDDYFSKMFKQVTGLSPTEYRTTITYKIK